MSDDAMTVMVTVNNGEGRVNVERDEAWLCYLPHRSRVSEVW